MVRPRERYRHGARRRSSAALDPVFVVTAPGVNLFVDPQGIGRGFEIHTGQDGKLAEVVPWQLSPPEWADNTDAGTMAAIAALYNSISTYSVDGSQWTGSRTFNTVPVFAQLLDGVVYLCVIRASYVRGQVLTTVTVTPPPQSGLPPETSLRSSEPFFTRAIYDTLTVAVNLETGGISHRVSPLYRWSVTVSGTASQQAFTGLFQFDQTRNENYTGYIEALAASLPTGHPFKSCGTVPWAFLSNLNIPVGDNQQTLSATILPPPRYPSTFELASQPSAAARLSRLKGYSSTASQRVLGGLIYERSDLASGWASCDGYAVLGEYSADSYSDYAAGLLEPREDLLRVDGYSSAEQTKLLQEPDDTSLQAMPSRVTGFPTSNRLYFRSFDASDPPSFLDGKIYWDLYWLVD